MILTIISILLSLIAIAMIVFYIIGRKTYKESQIYYDNVSIANKIDNLRDFVNNTDGTYILYIGRESCPDCRNFSGLFNKLVTTFDYLNFYYFDTDHIRDNKTKYADEDDFMSSNLEVTHVPSLLLIKNHSILGKLTESEITRESFNGMVSEL